MSLLKKISTNVTTSTLILSFVVSFVLPAGFIVYPQKAEAQAGAAASCVAGYGTAAISAQASLTQDIIGVSNSQLGRTAQDTLTGGSANAVSFNNCILKPLGTAIAITLIRNIGASVVNWVNSGFEGKPLFVTDFGGTLLDTADQVFGQFIEGSELGFLCNDFSFQIRLELALKYSQPFREQVRCTLSDIGSNVNSFVDNNGGTGWDNWLELTTRPTNNIYGAFLVADTEATQRALRAVGQKEKQITIGQGFLNFDTCDVWENNSDVIASQYAASNSSVVNPTALSTSSDNSFTPVNADAAENTTLNTNPTTISEFAGNFDNKPKCKSSSTKTPGGIIAGKLSSVLGQSEIQSAVAQEIDQVIAATLNQIAQKALQGAGGLLGLSKKNSSSQPSYLDRYRAQYYGDQIPGSVDIGASSELDNYQVGSYTDAQALLSNTLDPNIRAITDTVNANVDAASNRQQQQITTFIDTYGASNTATTNGALLKSTSQSSGTNPGAAVDGVTITNQYVKGSATYSDDPNPWWEVNIGAVKKITEVRIWKVSNKSSGQTLETFNVIARNNTGEVWRSGLIDGRQSANPIIIPINQSASSIRIQKNAAEISCFSNYQGYDDGNICYNPLELAEVQVITPIEAVSSTGTPTVSANNNQSSNSSQNSNTGSNSSVNNDPTSPVSIKDTQKTIQTGGVVAVNSPIVSAGNRQIGPLEVSLESSDGKTISFDSVFSDVLIGVKQDGVTRNFNPGSNGTMIFNGISTGPNHNSEIIISGNLKILPIGSSYNLKITAKDMEDVVLSSGTIKINVNSGN